MENLRCQAASHIGLDRTKIREGAQPWQLSNYSVMVPLSVVETVPPVALVTTAISEIVPEPAASARCPVTPVMV